MDTTKPRPPSDPDDTHPFTGAGADRALPNVPGYEVLELIGRGGMGRVYRARHLGLGRIVALKLLLQEADDHLLARFREETRAVARLQHPNIAQLYESGSANGRPYFAQEFLDGGSLSQALAGRPQPPRDAAALVEIVARAVHHSHTQGILHRDLKPGNILLARKSEARNTKSEKEEKEGGAAPASVGEFRISDFVPKVADFGLAKPLENRGASTKPDSGGALTRTGEILGTPGYMPPEQASGVVTNIGPTADVYALGAVLYEVLTGRPPFQSPDPVQTLMLVLTREPVSPRVLQPDLPRDLETICLKCLDKSPTKRYESARELADDLRRFLDGMPILARPVGAFERAAKWARRKKAAAALVAVSAVAGMLLLGAGVALAVGYFKLKETNADLEAKNTQLDQANKDITAKKNEVERAQEETEQTLRLSLAALDRFFFEFSERLRDVPKGEDLRLDALKQARATLEGLNRLRPDDPIVQEYRMIGFEKLGTIEAGRGDVSTAEADYTKSREIAAALRAKFPNEVGYKRNWVVVTSKLASLYQRRGDLKAANVLFDEMFPVLNELAVALPNDVRVLELKSGVLVQLLSREMRLDRWDESERRMRELCDLDRQIAKADPNNPLRVRNVIDGDRRLAMMLLVVNKVGEAEQILLRAQKEADALPDRTSVPVRRLRAAVHGSLGSLFDKQKQYSKAIPAYREALAEYIALEAEFEKSPLYRFQRIDTLTYLAYSTVLGGDRAAGLKLLEEAEQMIIALTTQHPTDTSFRALRTRISELLTEVRKMDKKP